MLQGNSRGASSSRWARWRELSGRERTDTVLALALIPLAHVSFRTLGVKRTLKLFTGRDFQAPPAEQRAGDSSAAAKRVAYAVNRASRRGLFSGNCLSRSTALLTLLRRRGIDAELHFGARTRERTFEAHAWVEFNGVPL